MSWSMNENISEYTAVDLTTVKAGMIPDLKADCSNNSKTV